MGHRAPSKAPFLQRFHQTSPRGSAAPAVASHSFSHDRRFSHRYLAGVLQHILFPKTVPARKETVLVPRHPTPNTRPREVVTSPRRAEITLLRDAPVLRELDEAQLFTVVAAEAQRQAYELGELINMPPGEHLVTIVVAGGTRIALLSQQGRELTLSQHQAGSVLQFGGIEAALPGEALVQAIGVDTQSRVLERSQNLYPAPRLCQHRRRPQLLFRQLLVLQRQIRHEPGTLRYDVTGGYHDDSRGDRELVRGT